MKKITLIGSGLLLAAGVFVTFSCNKPTLDTNTTTATDNNICENEFMRIVPTINSLTISHYGKGVRRVEAVKYPVISLVTDTTKVPWPRLLEINYGPAPGIADSSDGKVRYGQIYVSYTNYWSIIGSTATVTFSDYFVGSTNYSATITITRNSPTVFKMALVNGVCTSTNWKILYNANRTFSWIGGYNDTVPSHSEYSITGSGYGTDRNSVNYTFKITTLPLIKRGNCPTVCQGTLDITPAGLADRTVSFGNGTCTGQATVTINGQNFNVSM